MVNISAKTVVIDIVTQVTDKTSDGINKTNSSLDKLGDSLRRTQQQAEKLGKTKSELSLKDKATQVIEKTQKALKSITKKAWNITLNALDKATAPIRGIFNLIKNPLVLTVSMLGLGTGAANIFDTFVGFEKSMSNVQALMGLDTTKDAKALGDLTEKAREMGRSTTKSASEAAEAMGFMALAGWNQEKIEVGIKPTLRLSEAGDMELGRTSDLVTDSMSSLGLKAEELEDYLDKIAKTSRKANTDIDQLMESFLEIGGTVKQNNIPLEEASGLIGVLANRGVKGSEAGVALNSVLVNLTTGAGQAGEAMKKLGLSAFNSDGSFKGYAETLKELNEKTRDMTDEQKAYYLSSIGGKMRLSDLQKLLSGVSEEYDNLKSEIIDSKGALEEMAKTKNDNIYGDIKALQSAFDDVKLGLMSKLQPSVRKFIQWLTSTMPDIDKAVGKAADFFIEKVSKMKDKIDEFTNTSEWKNTDLFGKISIAWDEIIIQPFSNWWNSTGNAWFAEKAGEIGNGIGKGLTAGLLALLGFSPQEVVEDGISIGASFAEGFAKGFDIKKVGEAIIGAIKNLFEDAATLLPGGKEASSTSGLSAALIAYGGLKLVNLVKGVSSIGSALTTSGILGSASSGAGLLGLGSKAAITMGAGNLAGNASLSAGALSGLGLGSIAGGIIGIAGIGKGIEDIKDGNTARGVSKLGMVGAGAAAGVAIGSVVPVVGNIAGGLIGAGIGGAAALLSGDKLFRAEEEKLEEEITKQKEKQLDIEKNIHKIRDTQVQLKGVTDSINATKDLRKQWNDVRWELNQGNLAEEERLKKQREMKEIVQELAGLYPNMVSMSDEDNQNLGKKLDKLLQMEDMEKKKYILELQNQLVDSRNNFDFMAESYNNSKSEIENFDNEMIEFKEKSAYIKNLLNKAITASNDTDSFYEKNDYNSRKKFDKLQKDYIDKINEEMRGLGFSNLKLEDIINENGESSGKIEERIDETFKNLNNKQITRYDNFSSAQNSMNTSYQNEVALIEYNLGESFEEAAQHYEDMDIAQKEVFNNAIKQLEELNIKYKEFTDVKYADIIFRFSSQGNIISGIQGPMSYIPSTLEDFKPYVPHANGGILTKPHIGMVAEAGAEAIIPLSGANKYRGIELWKETGKLLGMFPEENDIQKHAQGGIFGDIPKENQRKMNLFQQIQEARKKHTQEQQNTSVSTVDIGGINLGGINVTFEGNGANDKESIMKTIRQQMPEIANDVAEQLAKALESIFHNMKANVT